MLKSIEKRRGRQLSNERQRPKMISGDDAPGFFLKHFVKDMRIALAQSGEELPVLAQVLNINESLEKAGFGDCGTQAMIHGYRKNKSGCL